MSDQKSYSLQEMDARMHAFIQKSGDELIEELREVWKQQKEEQYV